MTYEMERRREGLMSVVVVTGCSSGFGLEIAAGFAERGDHVVATMRNLEKAGPLRERLAEVGAREPDIRQLDVTDEESRSVLVSGVEAELGRIDVLVNNAGLAQWGPAEEMEPDFHRRLFETNYWGVFEMMRLVLPAMRERRGGRIVNMSSIAGILTGRNFGGYAASKHALDGLSAGMDLDLAPFGVRVVLVMPRSYGTSIGENTPVESLDRSAYGNDLRQQFDAFWARVNRNNDLSPVVGATIEAATAGHPRARYVVPAHAYLDGLVAAMEEQHQASLE
jgi:NAD(P)-dependent dehydrogenase (short-subunit alcohol dehydrogenase family)